jgi:thiol-activated cytolysin
MWSSHFAHVAGCLLDARRMRALSAFGVALLCGCASTDSRTPTAQQIDDYIAALPYLPVDPAQITQGTTTAPQRDGDYSCTVENLSETRQLDRIVAYAANSDSLWPGAIVSADSVLSGLFTQVVLPRAPQTVSISLENLAGTKTATIASPSLSSYRDAVSGILASEVTGSTPANIYSEIEQVHSQTQLDMALGVEASWGLGLESLKTSFDWSNMSTRSRYVVRYTQAYYTVDLDAPSSASALFDGSVTLDDVSAKMNEEHPPAYVSSVTYGRMIVFTFESSYSATELGAALQFAYAGGVDVSGDVSVTYKEILSRSKITAFILGGDGGTAAKTIDSYDALIAFIKDGGNYSKDSPGAPIAYKLSYLKDNSPARISLTTDYQVKSCARVAQQIKVTLQSIAVDDAAGDFGSDLELYGTIAASAASSTTLFDKNTSNYVTVHEGSAFGSAQSPIAENVVEVVPQAGNTLDLTAHLYDHDPLFTDDLGTEVSPLPFETGWRKDVTVTLTGSGARVRVLFSLTPI